MWVEDRSGNNETEIAGCEGLYKGADHEAIVRGGERPAAGVLNSFDVACATSSTLTSKWRVLPASGWLKSSTIVSFFTSEIRG